MDWIDRRLRIDLPARQSAFLQGPRKTGKSAFLRRTFPASVHPDLLRSDLQLDLLRRPALLRQRLMAMEPDRLAAPIVIEKQRARKAIVVCNEPVARRQDDIDLLPWREFLQRLWDGAVLR